MMIETSLMKFEEGPTRTIGKTTNPSALQIWQRCQHRSGKDLVF